MGSSISAGTPMIAESISAYHNISKTSRRTEEKKEDIAVPHNILQLFLLILDSQLFYHWHVFF